MTDNFLHHDDLKCMKNTLRQNNFLVPWHFIKSRFHCTYVILPDPHKWHYYLIYMYDGQRKTHILIWSRWVLHKGIYTLGEQVRAYFQPWILLIHNENSWNAKIVQHYDTKVLQG